jgi:Aminoglycoside-2''-adenylyltransferase
MNEQLVALASVHELLDRNGVDYWLFGGWAVDFYVGAVTRPHDDVDIAVSLADHDRIATLLVGDGWMHAPYEDEDGGTGYERDGVRLELTFLVREDDGAVSIPLRSGRAVWSAEPIGNDVVELNGVCARVVDRALLERDKSRPRDDPADAAKDAADFAALRQP